MPLNKMNSVAVRVPRTEVSCCVSTNHCLNDTEARTSPAKPVPRSLRSLSSPCGTNEARPALVEVFPNQPLRTQNSQSETESESLQTQQGSHAWFQPSPRPWAQQAMEGDAESDLDLRIQVAVLEAAIMQLQEERLGMRREAEQLQAQVLQKERENWLLVQHIRSRESKMYNFLRKMAVRLQIDKTVIVPSSSLTTRIF